MKHCQTTSRDFRARGFTYRGFTLIELLVVVAIVALLVALLLPSLARAKEAARVTRCASNQRQIRMAALSYSHDFDDLIVPFGLSGSNGRYWRFGLDPYLGHPKPPDVTRSFDDPIWDCPTHPSGYREQLNLAPYRRWESRTSYAINTVMLAASTGSGGLLPTGAMIIRPSDKFLFVEVRTEVPSAQAITNPYMSPVLQGGLASGYGWFGHLADDHTQVAFMDGHVKLLPRDHPGFFSPTGSAGYWSVNK